ncbi:MAG: polyprenyl synthetase family protein [Deltaproteobacteria bacterium]|nr:polyprenyl synthetase family protein [Deltaproteobacteria bacterium]
MTIDFSLSDYLKTRKAMIDHALEAYMPKEDARPPVLVKAMRYSLFAGGKRIRPILCLAAAEAAGGQISDVLPTACALEMIHTYSLIHDDLPAMDNDDLRRGRPTNHKVFGDAVAILAGDALLTEAFHLIAGRAGNLQTAPLNLLAVIRDIACAAGHDGMVGGQAVDILSEGAAGDAGTLHYIHTRKTAALIRAAVTSGACIAGAGREALSALEAYGDHIGLAFQIADDILNVEGSKEALGKNTGSDASHGKLTYPALMGLEASRNKLSTLVACALSDIEGFDGRAVPLREMAKYIMERKS